MSANSVYDVHRCQNWRSLAASSVRDTLSAFSQLASESRRRKVTSLLLQTCCWRRSTFPLFQIPAAGHFKMSAGLSDAEYSSYSSDRSEKEDEGTKNRSKIRKKVCESYLREKKMLLLKWNSCMLNLFFIFQLNPCNSIMKPFFLDIVPSLVEKKMDKVEWDILLPLCEVKNCIGWWKIIFDWDISSAAAGCCWSRVHLAAPGEWGQLMSLD